MQPPGQPEPHHLRTRSRVRLPTILIFGVVFLGIAIGSHANLLSMPYFWDEAGQFIPATLDLYREGSWLPQSATPNVHPPGVMAWIALWWKVFGPGVIVTRLAMLVLGGLSLLASFLLAVELCGSLPGVPALLAAALLAASPLFYTQSMLAQLDLPALLFTSLALWFFLREQHRWAVAASTALLLVKETGIVVPLVLAGWLLAERRIRRASLYLIPLTVLGIWLAVLRASTGHWLGNAAFAQYNFYYSLRPSQIAAALARRLYFLLIGNFHWIGTVAILAAWRAGWLNRRRWKAVGAFAVAHTILVSFLGGAVLERYMLPVLPLFYTAAVTGLHATGAKLRWFAFVALFAGLVAGLFVNPLFWPYPYENNLGMVDFTALQTKSARWLASNANSGLIATAWPLSAALTNPDLGYVASKLTVFEIRDFSNDSIRSLPKDTVDVLVRFSKDWEPPYSLLRHHAVRWFARRYLAYRDPASPGEIASRLRLRLVAAFEQGGQWVEIYAK